MTNSKITIGVIGGAGYTGGELIRILILHPNVEIVFIHSRSNAGKLISSVHQDLTGETSLLFSDKVDENVDAIFLCLGHGESRKFLLENQIPDQIKIIDLANDFRLESHSEIGKRKFVYGLPEINKDQIEAANSVANPGCFATAIQLGLLPLAQANLLSEVYTTGITGSTGAGQSLSATSHFSWRANNIQTYKTLTHQHLDEIGQSLHQVQTEKCDVKLNFVPWRGDFTRGIFVSSQLKTSQSLEQLFARFEAFYTNQKFVFLSWEPIFLKQVVNTNKAVIQLEKVGDQLVVHSAIVNLLKGASGQAMQNFNLMFGLTEEMGLKFKATGF